MGGVEPPSCPSVSPTSYNSFSLVYSEVSLSVFPDSSRSRAPMFSVSSPTDDCCVVLYAAERASSIIHCGMKSGAVVLSRSIAFRCPVQGLVQ